jgi:hypothetical protein
MSMAWATATVASKKSQAWFSHRAVFSAGEGQGQGDKAEQRGGGGGFGHGCETDRDVVVAKA